MTATNDWMGSQFNYIAGIMEISQIPLMGCGSVNSNEIGEVIVLGDYFPISHS